MAGEYNAGSIEASLRLDRSEFNRELTNARRDAEDFQKKTYTPKVSLDTSEAVAKIQSLQEDLKSLENIALGIALSGFDMVMSQLQEVQEQVSLLDGRVIHIDVDVDLYHAMPAFALIEDSIDALDGRQIHVQTDVDTVGAMAQLAALRAEIALISGSQVNVGSGGGGGGGGGAAGLGGLGASGSSAAGGLGMLATAIIALSPLIPPLVVVAAGAAATLVSFGVAAAGAVGVFGAATMGAVKQSQAHAQAVSDTAQKLKSAQEQLAKTTAGTDSYKNALKNVTDAEKAHKKALQDQTKEEKGFTDALKGVSGAWSDFITATEKYTLKPVQTVLEGVTAALPKLTPLVEKLATPIDRVAGGIKRWLSGDGMKGFTDFIASTGLPILDNLVGTLAGFARASGGIIKAFAPVAVKLSGWLKDLADKSAAWANSGGATRFKDKFIEAWHQLEPTFKALIDGLKTIWDLLSGVSQSHSLVLIDLLKAVSDTLKALKPGSIKLLNTGFESLHKILAPLVPVLTTAGTGLSDLMTALDGPVGDFLGKVSQAVQILTPTVVTVVTQLFAAIKDNVGRIAPVLSLAGSGILMIAKGLAAVYGAIPPLAFKIVFTIILALPLYVALVIAALLKLKIVFLAIGDAALWLWNHAIKPTWNAIAATAVWLWNTVLKPTLSFIAAAFMFAGKIWWTVWSTYFKVVFILIEAGIKALWVFVIKPVLGKISDHWHALGIAVKGVWNAYLKPVWDAVANAATRLWKAYIAPAWDGIRSAISGTWSWIKNNVFSPMGTFFTKTIPGWAGTMKRMLVETFDSAWKGVQGVWANIEKALGTPVKAAIALVWNDAIWSIMDKISGFVHAKNPLPRINTNNIPSFAEGGPVPHVAGSQRGKDSVHSLLMPDEHVLTTADVTAMGGQDAVTRFRSALHRGKAVQGANGTGRFGLGGYLSSEASSLKNAVTSGLSDLGSAVLGSLSPVVNPMLNAAEKAIDKVIPDNGGWSDLAQSLLTSPIEQIKSYVGKADKKAQASGGNLGTIPTGQHLAVINAALAAASVPPPGTAGQWKAGLNTLISRESGWNASAVNNWDSNAKAGHPSSGLAQTIEPTFRAYHVAGTSDNIFDPVANVAAAISYIVSRYGNITNVQQANASKTPKGYATGTRGAAPGLAWVGERGRELVDFNGGEVVYNHADSMRMAIGDLHGYASGTTRYQKELHTVRSAYSERDKDAARRAAAQKRYDSAHTAYLNATTKKEQEAAKKEMAKYKTAFDRANKEIASDNKLIKLNAEKYKGATAQVKQERADAAALAAARKKAMSSERSTAQNFVATQKAAIDAKIATATEARTGYYDTALQTGQLSNLTGNRASGFVAQLKDKIKAIKDFGTNLNTLAKLGLSRGLIQQIAAMGPDQGGPLAQSLARTTTSAGVKDLNSTYAQLDKASASYADTAANDGFGLSKLKAQSKVLAETKITVTAPHTIKVRIGEKEFTAHTEEVVEKKVKEIIAAAGKKK